MKTELMSRVYALLGSVAFALVATTGVAVMMTKSGDQTWTQASAAAAATAASALAASAIKAAKPVTTPALSESIAATTRQVM